MPPIVYLVSGANRGLGLALVKTIAAQDNTIVFAGTRDVSKSSDLDKLAAASPSKIHVLKLVSADLENNKAAVEEIKRIAGRLDVVIANAGIAFGYKSSLETPLQDVQDHFTVNVVGPLALFQTTYPLLKASTSTPKFVPISSTMGSIEKGSQMPTFQMPYGTSKAGLNWLIAKLRSEHLDLVAFPICPGPLDTDMASVALESDPVMKGIMEQYGMKLGKPEEVASNIVKRVAEGTRETSTFISHDGSAIPW